MEDCIKQGSYMKDNNFYKNDCQDYAIQLNWQYIVVFLRRNNFFHCASYL